MHLHRTSCRPVALAFAALSACAAWSPAAADECFEIYNPAGALVYRSTTSPVDLSAPISAGLQALGLDGHHLTHYPAGSGCEEVGVPGSDVEDAVSAMRKRDATLQRLADRYPAVPASTAFMYPSSAPYYDRRVYTGPRGGRYVITESGSRHYVGRGRR